MRRIAASLVLIIAVAAVILYLVFDPATATLFLAAGVTLSLCAASTTLLGAYSRNKALAREREHDDTPG